MGRRGDDGDDEARGGGRPGKKELRRALGEAVAGFRALERDVEVDGRRAADVLGVDGDGRAWLAVLVRDARDGRAAGRALAALTLARGGKEALERLLLACGAGSDGLDRERAPGVVVAVPAEDAALVDGLRPLVELGVRLVVVSRIAARSGAASIARSIPGPDDRARAGSPVGSSIAAPGAVADVAPDGAPGDAGRGAGLGAFLGALPPADAERAAHLLRRLGRLDEELASDARGRGVHVSIEGRPLCTLTAVEGRLAGAVASERPGADARTLAGQADVERFVEAVVGRYLAVADRPAAGDEDDGLGPLPEHESAPPPRPVQLLTREELEAFHG